MEEKRGDVDKLNTNQSGVRGLLSTYILAWKEGFRFIIFIIVLWFSYRLWQGIEEGPYRDFLQAIKFPAAVIIVPIWCYIVSRLLFPELPRGKLYKETVEYDG